MNPASVVKCRAANPATCRHHGSLSQQAPETIQSLKDSSAKALRDGNSRKYWAIQDDLRARNREEYEIRQASWTTTERLTASHAFLTCVTASPEKQYIETSPSEYEASGTDALRNLSDQLENAEVEVEHVYENGEDDIIRSVHVPVLGITITNNIASEEAAETGNHHWYQ